MPSTPQDPLARMRAHKGNAPTLPQTKSCSLCSAKFTRTTHLSRHLRSHNDDRIYRCNLCQRSEFTRSDLLIRHKRTCGQRVNRYRKTACEACAESKIKCNLGYPCAKCTFRGRECVFKFQPNQSRSWSPGTSQNPSSPACSTRGSGPPTPSLSSSPSPADYSRATSSSPSSHVLGLPKLVDCGGSLGPSSIWTSPRSETFSTLEEQGLGFPSDIGTYDNIISPFDGFLSSSSSLGLPLSCGGASDASSLPFDEEMDLFSAVLPVPSPPASPPPNLFVDTSRNLLVQPPVTLPYADSWDIQRLFGPSFATTDMYLHLFFTRFLTQVPLLHAPTWRMADTPPFLARIFHACGALFLDTPEAAVFVATTFSSSAAEITEKFGMFDDGSSRYHVHVIVGLVLLQTITLLRREGERAAPPNTPLHAMLVAMIRQTGLIARVASWSAPDLTPPIPLQTTWIEWAEFATIKRAVLLAYFHDCCHCMYSASPPAFLPAEMHIPLPCDDALWHAPTAAAWFTAAHTPGPYGVGRGRIRGTSMQVALAALAAATATPAANTNANITADAAQPPLTSFGLFILIHTLLRNLSVAQCAPRLGSWASFGKSDGGTVRAQKMLDNWLQIWLESPEAANGGAGQTATFVCNLLPFYWLAQVSLWEGSWSGPAFIDPGLLDPRPR
ncbi:hypothetical protein B0H14DRAFT_2334836 [Mycena olivaceomarginata]|nr:hypothetical protein B0H14DRAFT_2334836 [Mycena olivaceomarginata]